MSRSLIVLPEDSGRPLTEAIHAANEALSVKMFAFSDPSLLDAVIEAKKRGVHVRVMLNPARRNGDDDNKETREALLKAGVPVMDSNPAFDLTHEKSMIVDNKTAFVMSLNWETKNLTETRDYAISTSSPEEVDEMRECFDADWNRSAFTHRPESSLIWCVGNGRQRIGQFIDAAKHTLLVQNERYQDPVIIEHLVRATLRGVKVHLMASPPHKLHEDKLGEGVSGLRILRDVGAKVHRLKHAKLHAKVLLADGKRAIIGSINFAPGSFDSRRELAIEVSDEHVIKRLNHTVEHDWEHSRPLDLSDEGLLAEMEKHGIDCQNELAIAHETHAQRE
jgi:phosphatidylserine/phosphatidylglycerophosphate/cardiolipin synthase-like enzyme